MTPVGLHPPGSDPCIAVMGGMPFLHQRQRAHLARRQNELLTSRVARPEKWSVEDEAQRSDPCVRWWTTNAGPNVTDIHTVTQLWSRALNLILDNVGKSLPAKLPGHARDSSIHFGYQ